jgi:hypothetical protein
MRTPVGNQKKSMKEGQPRPGPCIQFSTRIEATSLIFPTLGSTPSCLQGSLRRPPILKIPDFPPPCLSSRPAGKRAWPLRSGSRTLSRRRHLFAQTREKYNHRYGILRQEVQLPCAPSRQEREGFDPRGDSRSRLVGARVGLACPWFQHAHRRGNQGISTGRKGAEQRPEPRIYSQRRARDRDGKPPALSPRGA